MQYSAAKYLLNQSNRLLILLTQICLDAFAYNTHCARGWFQKQQQRRI